MYDDIFYLYICCLKLIAVNRRFHIFGTPCVSKLICNGMINDQLKNFYRFLWKINLNRNFYYDIYVICEIVFS